MDINGDMMLSVLRATTDWDKLVFDGGMIGIVGTATTIAAAASSLASENVCDVPVP